MTIKQVKYNFIIYLVLALGLVSCVDNNMYHHYNSIESSTWNEKDSYRFDVVVTDTISAYDIFLEIRNNNTYPYENLWLFVTYETQENGRRKDTLDCRLADAHGKWLGKGFSQYTSTIPYEKSVIFPHSGTYTYILQQGMREAKLKGITDIGIRISPIQ